jgi:hypothetical protein
VRTRPFSLRWTLVALVLAFLGSTFAASAHWLSVPHRLCEVHGTIEHGLAPEPTPPENPLPRGPVAREPAPAHDGCSVGPYARIEAIPPAHDEGHGLLVAEPRGRAFVPAAPVASVPLLLLAPSRSPPV